MNLINTLQEQLSEIKKEIEIIHTNEIIEQTDERTIFNDILAKLSNATEINNFLTHL